MSVESDFFTKLKALETAAVNLSRLYDDLESNASYAVAFQYPFKESFDEVSANIVNWRENVRTQFKEMGYLIPEHSLLPNAKIKVTLGAASNKKIKKGSLEFVTRKLLNNGLIDEILTEKEQETIAMGTSLFRALDNVVKSEFDRDEESRNIAKDTLAEFERLIIEARGKT